MNSIVKLENINVQFSSRVILSDLSLEVFNGDFIVMAGKNGSGKSVLLKTIMGFIRPKTGTVSIFGISANGNSFRKNLHKIGYIPQILNIDYRSPFTVENIVSMGRYGSAGILGRLTDEDRKIINDTMAEIGISHLADRPIGQLSGGERQKVQIARVLCQKPNLLILDEPMSHLDLGAQYEIVDLMQDIYQEKKIPIILVMHDLYYIPDKCNRAVVIHNGKKHFDGSLNDMLTSGVLQPVYNSHTEQIIQKSLCRSSFK